jgi:hypothetical protein
MVSHLLDGSRRRGRLRSQRLRAVSERSDWAETPSECGDQTASTGRDRVPDDRASVDDVGIKPRWQQCLGAVPVGSAHATVRHCPTEV